MGMLCASAQEENGIQLVLSSDTQTDGNAAYARDGRVYERDLTKVLVNGMEALRISQTNESVTYICPVDAGAAQAALSFTHAGVWTTVEVNGQLLSADAPVTVSLGEDNMLRLATKNRRTAFHLILTTMPVAVIDYKGSDLYANNVGGTMTLYDPDFAAHGLRRMDYTTPVTIGYRGQSSKDYAKHNYSLHLKTADGDQNKTSLLGMRKDDDWILSGAMNDKMRLRNTVTMEIWDQLYTLPWTDVSGAVDGEYCEVFLNGQYMGLFCLMEKLDRKQADLDKENGCIVRSVEDQKYGVNIMAFDYLGRNAPADSPLWYNMEMKFPKEEDVRSADWQRFYEFVRFVSESSDEVFAAEIDRYIDLENFAAYYVYITAIGATGNMNKNLYFVMEDTEDAAGRWYLVPWDVDGSFGRRNNASVRDVNIMSGNALFKRLIRTDAQGFCKLLRDTWQSKGKQELSYENIMSVFEKYYQALDRQGVWEREQKKWPLFGASYRFDAHGEYQYIAQYMLERKEFTDAYFAQEDLLQGNWQQ